MEDDIIIPKDVYLEVISGVDKGMKFLVENKTITIGRNEACDMKLSDEYISNKHCQIVFRDDHFTIIDLQSLNKTKVNGNVFQQRNLNSEDIITLGHTEIQFTWENPDL